MTLLFANNAYGTLAGPITNTATSANLAAGTGALFPNPTAPDYFKMTFVDAATGLVSEIVHVTARTNDNITIVRGREGTAAQNWLAGDLAQNLWTAGSAQAMLQSVQQSGFFQGTDTATDPNNMTVPAVLPALSAPPVAGQIYFVTKGNNPNTGNVKLLVGNGVTAGTSQPVVFGDGSQLASGDWPGTASAWLYYTGSVYQLMSPIRSTVNYVANYVSNNYAKGSLIAIRTFTSSQTYTPTAGTNKIRVTITAGGGAGGATASTSASQFAAGGGGAGGGTAIGTLTSGFSSVAMVVGAGGTPSSTNGGPGGNSSFGTLTANGGSGGALGAANNVPAVQAGGTGGTASGGGEANISGGAGGISVGFQQGNNSSGFGGQSFWGPGASAVFSSSTVGSAAVNFGSGGSGAVAANSAGPLLGGAGAGGFIRVEEFA